MRLSLGTRSVDLTTRPLVVGTLDDTTRPDLAVLGRRAAQLAADGADVVEVVLAAEANPAAARDAVAHVAASLAPHRPDAAVAVAVRARRAPSACAALDAGAVLVTGPLDPTGELLPACAKAGAAVVVSARGNGLADVRARLVEGARHAEAFGIPPDRIIVEPILDRALVPHVRRFAELGYPLLVTVTGPTPAPLGDHPARPGSRPGGRAAALTALAVIGGCRVVRTDDVRAAQRICRVLAAILEAR